MKVFCLQLSSFIIDRFQPTFQCFVEHAITLKIWRVAYIPPVKADIELIYTKSTLASKMCPSFLTDFNQRSTLCSTCAEYEVEVSFYP